MNRLEQMLDKVIGNAVRETVRQIRGMPIEALIGERTAAPARPVAAKKPVPPWRKLQGRYLGLMRHLTKKQQAVVRKAYKAAKAKGGPVAGFRAAIKTAGS